MAKVPYWMTQGADEQADLTSYLKDSGYPLGDIEPEVQESPRGAFGLDGGGLDSASLSVLQALQNAPRPRGFAQNAMAGFAGGLAGGRARQANQRTQANEQAVGEAKDLDKERRRSAASYLATYRGQQRRDAAATAKPKVEPKKEKTLADIEAEAEARARGQRKGAPLAGPRDVGIARQLSPDEESRIDRIVEGIKRGEASPDVNDYGRDSGVRMALTDRMLAAGISPRVEANKLNAERTFLRSANGTVALRGYRNVVNARESLDYTETLLDESLGTIPRGQFTILNRAQMLAAAEGIHGPEAAASARKLKAQVAAVRFELSNIYMGGTAPTDQAVKKAMDVIDSDWSEAGLRGAIALARRDLGIRVNAINEVGPIHLDKDGGVKGGPKASEADSTKKGPVNFLTAPIGRAANAGRR